MTGTPPVRLGLALPHTVAGGRREMVAAAEAVGYRYLTLADHVLGADVTNRPDWKGLYTAADPFREVFVHLGHLAALTTLELVPSILVLPQRQTALVAKQAAELALLSEGGVRLGVGVGWNAVEYEALGADFATRGARMEEQIHAMRLLWTHPSVTFEGAHHHFDEVGIAPLPPAPIPVWIGGGLGGTDRARERVLRRIATLGDGWITPPPMTPERLAAAVADLREAAESAGRDPATLGVQATLTVFPGDDPAVVRARAASLLSAGPTHITIDCRSNRGGSLAEHIDTSSAAAEVISREI